MKNDATRQPPSPTTLPERVRNRLASRASVRDEDAIRIVTATAQNWPELTYVGADELALGDDGLIRCALWSASQCCASLLGARRVTLLLPQGGDTCEIRCLVLANASLTTTRPLSGFLLKPVEFLDGCASRSALKIIRNGASESRLALFDAFPVRNDGEKVPP